MVLMQIHRVYGLTFASNYSFASRFLAGTGRPDFTFTSAGEMPIPADWRSIPPAYVSAFTNEAGESLLRVHRTGDCDVMHFPGMAEYYLFADRVVYRPLGEVESEVEANFLSSVLAFWLERTGVLAMHASAVALPSGAVAFLANSGNGKSTLAAALLKAGNSLLSDDILALVPPGAGWQARSGFPTMRMWPAEACWFLGGCETLPRIHPAFDKRLVTVGDDGWGAFCADPQPLSRVILPERRDPSDSSSDISLTPLSPRDAVIELVRHSFAARLVQGIGLQAGRMDLFVDLVRRVPMVRLSYPSGFQHLERVRLVVENGSNIV